MDARDINILTNFGGLESLANKGHETGDRTRRDEFNIQSNSGLQCEDDIYYEAALNEMNESSSGA